MKRILFLILVLLVCSGCFPKSKPDYIPQLYKTPDLEAEWIRKGEPLIYQDQTWYPVDDTENLTDLEVYRLGEYRGVLFFVSKEDVEPYDRLYTKFSRNRYRYYRVSKE